jgi:hypothetical protein
MTLPGPVPRTSGTAARHWPGWIPLLLAAGCPSRSGPSAAPSATVAESPAAASSPATNAARATCAVRVLAELPGGLTSLFAAPEGIYGATEGGAIVRIVYGQDGGSGVATTIASHELTPYRVVARGGQPAWLSSRGLVGFDGEGRHPLAPDADSVAVGAKALYLSGSAGLSAIDWPASTTARLLSSTGKGATELVAIEPWIVGSSPDGSWAYNIETGVIQPVSSCPDDRCHGPPRDWTATADRTGVTWHEGPADLLPGPKTRAYRMTLGSWKVSVLPIDEGDMWPSFVVGDGCVFARGQVRGLDQRRWTTTTPGVMGALRPIAENGREWFWVEDGEAGRARIVSASMAGCCAHALANQEP